MSADIGLYQQSAVRKYQQAMSTEHKPNANAVNDRLPWCFAWICWQSASTLLIFCYLGT